MTDGRLNAGMRIKGGQTSIICECVCVHVCAVNVSALDILFGFNVVIVVVGDLHFQLNEEKFIACHGITLHSYERRERDREGVSMLLVLSKN